MMTLLDSISDAHNKLTKSFSDLETAADKMYQDSPMGAIEDNITTVNDTVAGVESAVLDSDAHQFFMDLGDGAYGSGSYGSAKYEGMQEQPLPKLDSVDANADMRNTMSQGGINNFAASQITGGLPMLPLESTNGIGGGVGPAMAEPAYGQDNLDTLTDIEDTPTPALEDEDEDEDETVVKTGALSQ